ncbi:Ig-like domain-containing protein [Flagellimonas baculiformis]|uniref:Ig-like domain-containing protein n=1 Tax=Flagellimonas baculiformis TaxID=3067310 RepID=UPI00296F6C31|nr:Ig-like domain-containing protein [Muricauda sp. D6]
MKHFLPHCLLIFLVSFLFSCSSDSEEPAPEPDTVAPQVDFSIAGSQSSNTDVPVVVSNQIEISIDAKDSGGIAKVEAFIDDQKVGEDTSAPYQIIIDVSNYTSKQPSTNKFTDYTLKITVTDTSGNETSKDQIIHIDNELPSVTNVTLTNGQVIGGDTNMVTFNVSDNEGLTSTAIYLNDELLSEIVDGLYEVNINTLELSDGENNFKIEAIDLADNKTIHEVVFIADNTGPEITLESLMENPVVDETLLLSPEIIDAHSDIVSVEFLMGEDSQTLIEGQVAYEWELDPETFTTGSASVFIKAIDNLNNETIAEFPIEILRRLLTISIPANFYNPETTRLFVFASGMDGQLLDIERIYDDTTIIKLHTDQETNGDFEYMLTFAEYITGPFGNATELTTVQNILPSALPEMNLKLYKRFSNQVESYILQTENFDFNDQLSLTGWGADYSASFSHDNNGPTGEVYIEKSQNTSTPLQSNSMYLSLYNYTMSEYSYSLLDANVSSNPVLTPDMFTTEGVERRVYEPIINGEAVETSGISLYGYMNQEEFDNNIYHLIYAIGYQFLPDGGIPYFISDAFTHYKYNVRLNDYFTERTGEPVASFTPVDWTIDYTFSNNQFELSKSGTGHTIGKISIDSDAPEVINGLNIMYRWNLVFDSQEMDQVVLPEIPEEIQSWGFYPLYENNNLKVQQVELRGYEGIIDYDSYLTGVIKSNTYPYSISPKMESKFKSLLPGYYYRAPNFLLD